MQPAGARCCPQLFLFPGGQGNLIFVLPACSGSLLWSVTGRWPGGSRDAGFLQTRWRVGAGGIVGAGAWPWCSWRNVQTQSCPGARPWKSQGSAAGEEGAHFGVPGAVTLPACCSAVVCFICRERGWSEPACSSLGDPSALARRHAGYAGPVWGDRGCCALHPHPSCPLSGHPRRCSRSVGVGCAGPGCSLQVPGLSSEACSALAADKIKPGLRLSVSHASDRSLQGGPSEGLSKGAQAGMVCFRRILRLF